MEEMNRTSTKKNYGNQEGKQMKNSLENGLSALLKEKKILVYFVLTQGSQIERDLLENTYQQFRLRMNYEYHLDIFPERPTSKISTSNPGLLQQIVTTFNQVLEEQDDKLYFFFVLDGALDDLSFLRPDSQKVQVLTVQGDKTDELYKKGISALDRFKGLLAS
ncbi:MAG: hypothetical protein PHY47_00665 [Lachnospiraceae bacterium]|nr:hypothetical protein [Lachnospiraceae bacterium]